jgi:hypothetical protein
MLNGQDIPFINSIKYLGEIFDKKITWRLHIEMNKAKDFKTFIRIYPLFKSEQLIINIKFTLHKALNRSAIIYACIFVTEMYRNCSACKTGFSTPMAILQG